MRIQLLFEESSISPGEDAEGAGYPDAGLCNCWGLNHEQYWRSRWMEVRHTLSLSVRYHYYMTYCISLSTQGLSKEQLLFFSYPCRHSGICMSGSFFAYPVFHTASRYAYRRHDNSRLLISRIRMPVWAPWKLCLGFGYLWQYWWSKLRFVKV